MPKHFRHTHLYNLGFIKKLFGKNESVSSANEHFSTHAEEMSQVLKKFESEAMEMEKKYEHKLVTQYESLMLKHHMEMTEVEERKDSYIVELTKNHEKTLAEMKNYYNDITLNNLSLIKSMKEQMETMKNHENRLSKQVQQSSNENKKYSVDLIQAQGVVADLTRRLGNYEKDKQCLASTKKRLAIALKELEHLKWENEVLELRFEKCQSERDELHARFVSSILEIQQKTGLKNVLLEKKLEKVSYLLEQRESQMSHVLVASKEDPNIFTEVNIKFEETLNRKNAAIRDLQYEVAKACKAHDDLLTIYEEKLRQHGISEVDFGVQPIRSQGSAAKFGRKSSLVTVNR